MILFDQWYLPTGEEHLQAWMSHANYRFKGRLTYQKHKYDAAMKHVRQRRLAVDVGAHVGLWSFWMAQDFTRLEAFEPKPEHVACWRLNLEGAQNATLHEVALGAIEGSVGLRTGPSSSGDTRVVVGGDGILQRTLDSYQLEDVDFLKVDCEGYEAFVLEGAVETVTRCRPVVIVEQKPGHGQSFGRGELDAVTILKGLGARQVWDYAGDYVLVFTERR